MGAQAADAVHDHRSPAAPQGAEGDPTPRVGAEPQRVRGGGALGGGARPRRGRAGRGRDERRRPGYPDGSRHGPDDPRGRGRRSGRLAADGLSGRNRMNRWAEALYAARRDRAPIAPISGEDPSLTPADAYAIQQDFARLILREGGSVVGYKLGLTSTAMQELLGVDQPDYGPVLSSMVFDDGAALSIDELIQPRAEAEIALVLERPLRGPGATTEGAAAAIGGARAAIEIVDSRIRDWKITLVDTIADLASSAAIVLGPEVVPVDGWEPAAIEMQVARNGRVQATGVGAAALGDPVYAVAWLANTLAPFGVTLEPGHFVMTGALHAAFPIEAGDEVRASFDRLGEVRVRFEGGRS